MNCLYIQIAPPEQDHGNSLAMNLAAEHTSSESTNDQKQVRDKVCVLSASSHLRNKCMMHAVILHYSFVLYQEEHAATQPERSLRDGWQQVAASPLMVNKPVLCPLVPNHGMAEKVRENESPTY